MTLCFQKSYLFFGKILIDYDRFNTFMHEMCEKIIVEGKII